MTRDQVFKKDADTLLRRINRLRRPSSIRRAINEFEIATLYAMTAIAISDETWRRHQLRAAFIGDPYEGLG